MSPQAGPPMSKFAAFVRLSRLEFLLGGFAGFALGVTVAAAYGARVTPAMYAAGQALVTAFHLMTHYANEYFDRESDRDAVRTPFSGGSGVLVAGTLAPRTALLAALVCASAGAVLVVWFAARGEIAAATIGAAIGLGAWSYSAPPLRLAGRGWGELDSTIVVALLVPLAGYAVASGSVAVVALRATVAPACAMFALMIAVEWPDRVADAAAGKRNLVVRWGTRAAARLGLGAALLAVAAFALNVETGPGRSLAAGLSLVLGGAVAAFASSLRRRVTSNALIAAGGVALYFMTVVLEIVAYAAGSLSPPAVPRCRAAATHVIASVRPPVREWGR